MTTKKQAVLVQVWVSFVAAFTLAGVHSREGDSAISTDIPDYPTELIRHENEYSNVRIEPARMGQQFGLAVIFEGTHDLHYFAKPETAPAPGFELKVRAKSDDLDFGDAIFPTWETITDPFGSKVEVYCRNFAVLVPIVVVKVPTEITVADVEVTISGIACTSMHCLPPFEKVVPRSIDLSRVRSWKEAVEDIQKVQHAVTTVLPFDKAGNPLEQGSGFFVGNNGHLITNHHVIEGAYSATVRMAEGGVWPVAGVLVADANSDIVRLLVETDGAQTPHVSPVNTLPLVGEHIAIVGGPLQHESAICGGIVSAVREIEGLGQCLQMAAPVSPGSSGGPVIDMKGQVVGIATRILKKQQALNFVVPSEKILSLIETQQVTLLPDHAEEAQMKLAAKKEELIRRVEAKADTWDAYSGFGFTFLHPGTMKQNVFEGATMERGSIEVNGEKEVLHLQWMEGHCGDEVIVKQALGPYLKSRTQDKMRDWHFFLGENRWVTAHGQRRVRSRFFTTIGKRTLLNVAYAWHSDKSNRTFVLCCGADSEGPVMRFDRELGKTVWLECNKDPSYRLCQRVLESFVDQLMKSQPEGQVDDTGKALTTPDEGRSKMFNKFGVSFKYPADMAVIVLAGAQGKGEPSYKQGNMVLTGRPKVRLAVVWREREIDRDPTLVRSVVKKTMLASVNHLISREKEKGYETYIETLSPRVESFGHRTQWCRFLARTDRQQIVRSIGSWWCPNSHRVFCVAADANYDGAAFVSDGADPEVPVGAEDWLAVENDPSYRIFHTAMSDLTCCGSSRAYVQASDVSAPEVSADDSKTWAHWYRSEANKVKNGTDAPKPTGTIRGHVHYKDLKSEEAGIPIGNVRIALCRLFDERGLPEGTVIASGNKGNLEHIGIIQAERTIVADSAGSFVLDNVPVGTYLILFHLWPDELSAGRTDWHDIVITEGHYDFTTNNITASGRADFWEDGGEVVGLANWSRDEGMWVTEGTAISKTYGFCFGIRDGKAHPIVTVQANSKIDVLVLTHVAPKKD